LRGWVRNRRHGDVEALLIGEPATVKAMVDACRQGPRWATVTSVERHPAADDGSAGFSERPTV
jgi:acylphosphatase